MKKINILIVAVSFLLGVHSVHAMSSSQIYSLKGVSAGSKIPSIDATSTIPFNKRFDALSSEQQNLVRAKFDNLGVNDTPPFPISGLKAVYKPVVMANKTYGDNSALKVTVTISKKGRVSDVQVHSDVSAEVISYIERELQYAKFQAASCNGTACEMDFPIEISFN